MCEGKYYLIFDAIIFTGDIMLGLLSAIMAYKTKKHLPEDKKYRKYHESAVINLTTMMALFLSSICESIVILFPSIHIQNGVLLIITLRECFWLCPVIYLLFVPKVSTKLDSYAYTDWIKTVSSLDACNCDRICKKGLIHAFNFVSLKRHKFIYE